MLLREDLALRVLAVAREHVHLRVFGKARDEPARLRQRRGQIGIHEKCDLAPRAEHPGAHGVAFATLDVVAHDRQARPPRRDPARDVQRAVRAFLDDENDLMRPSDTRKVCVQLREARLQAMRLVVGRDDD